MASDGNPTEQAAEAAQKLLDSFKEQIANLLAEATTKKSEVEKAASDSLTAIVQTAQSAKQSLAEIDELKISAATIKGGLEATHKSADADKDGIAKAKIEVDGFKSAASGLSAKVDQQYKNVAASIDELSSQREELATVLKDVAAAKAAVDGDSVAAKAQLKELSDAKDLFVKLNAETQSQYDVLVEKQTALQSKSAEIEAANSKIVELRKKLLDGSEGAKSVQSEIEDLKAQIASSLSDISEHRKLAEAALNSLQEKADKDTAAQAGEWNKKFDTLYVELKTEILKLLPSAGSAGLAWTYFDAKARYAPTPVASTPGIAEATDRTNWINRWFGYNPLSWASTIFFYALFMLPLGLLAWGTFDLILQIEHNGRTVPSWGLIALRFLVAVPLATISTFGFISLSLYRRMYEQYNHKQRVMELYVSFKREIEASGNDEQKQKLLTIMLDSVAEKAWQDSGKSEATETVDDAISKLDKWAGLATKLKGFAS